MPPFEYYDEDDAPDLVEALTLTAALALATVCAFQWPS